jgi:hypothetical protein
MSSENSTHFQFSLAAIDLEISGERAFVEKMYRIIMQDIEAARALPAPDAKSTAKTASPADMGATISSHGQKRPKTVSPDSQVVWVHRCSEMMHKIYMSSPEELSRAPLMRVLDPKHIAVLFADEEVVDVILPKVEKGHTLWAELTAKGRKRIQNNDD